MNTTSILPGRNIQLPTEKRVTLIPAEMADIFGIEIDETPPAPKVTGLYQGTMPSLTLPKGGWAMMETRRRF